jgi:ribonuclease-3
VLSFIAKIYSYIRYPKNPKFGFRLYKLLGFKPGSLDVYELALVHKSASIEHPDGSYLNNERLEFLGDAVLSSIIAEYLFNIYPDKDEGFLTEMRAKIVKRSTLNMLSGKIGLNKFIVSNVNTNKCKNFKGDALEALIGSVFIDKGYYKTKHFILNRIINSNIELEKLEVKEVNFKSRIIEWGQKNRKELTFEIKEGFNEKSQPVFISHLILLDEVIGSGSGYSKKEAEQKASKEALNFVHQYF